VLKMRGKIAVTVKVALAGGARFGVSGTVPGPPRRCNRSVN
jgi:hypothetical protein